MITYSKVLFVLLLTYLWSCNLDQKKHSIVALETILEKCESMVGDSASLTSYLDSITSVNTTSHKSDYSLYLKTLKYRFDKTISKKKKKTVLLKLKDQFETENKENFLKYFVSHALYINEYNGFHNYIKASEHLSDAISFLLPYKDKVQIRLGKLQYQLGYISQVYLINSKKANESYQSASEIFKKNKLYDRYQKVEYNLALNANSLEESINHLQNAISCIKNYLPEQSSSLWGILYPLLIDKYHQLEDFESMRSYYMEAESLHDEQQISEKSYDLFMLLILEPLLGSNFLDEFNFQKDRLLKKIEPNCEDENRYRMNILYDVMAKYARRQGEDEDERKMQIKHLNAATCGPMNSYYLGQKKNALSRLVSIDSLSNDQKNLNNWLTLLITFEKNQNDDNQDFLGLINYWSEKDIKNKESEIRLKNEKLTISKRLLHTTLVSLLILGILFALLSVYYKKMRTQKIKLEEQSILIQQSNLELQSAYEKEKSYQLKLLSKNEFLTNELKRKLLVLSQHDALMSRLGQVIAKSNLDELAKRKLTKKIQNYRDKDLWNGVEGQFFGLNEEYIKKLTAIYPNLSNNNIKLCILIKSNLSNKEIAKIRFITPDSVKVAKNRLRKRLNVPDSFQALSVYLNSLD